MERKVNIMGMEYTIIERSEEVIEGDDGLCEPHKHELHLTNTLRDREALLHEIGHGILFEGGLYCAIPVELREVIVQQFAQVINGNFYIRFRN